MFRVLQSHVLDNILAHKRRGGGRLGAARGGQVGTDRKNATRQSQFTPEILPIVSIHHRRNKIFVFFLFQLKIGFLILVFWVRVKRAQASASEGAFAEEELIATLLFAVSSLWGVSTRGDQSTLCHHPPRYCLVLLSLCYLKPTITLYIV